MRATIIDGDQSVQTVLALALEREGINVVSAKSLEDVLAISPEIVFIDRSHPLFTPQNVELLYQHIAPVIIGLDSVYGFVPEDNHPHITGWLQKPFTVQQIRQVLASVV